MRPSLVIPWLVLALLVAGCRSARQGEAYSEETQFVFGSPSSQGRVERSLSKWSHKCPILADAFDATAEGVRVTALVLGVIAVWLGWTLLDSYLSEDDETGDF